LGEGSRARGPLRQHPHEPAAELCRWPTSLTPGYKAAEQVEAEGGLPGLCWAGPFDWPPFSWAFIALLDTRTGADGSRAVWSERLCGVTTHAAAASWLGTSRRPPARAARGGGGGNPPGQPAWPWPGPSAWTAGRSSKSPRHGRRAEGGLSRLRDFACT